MKPIPLLLAAAALAAGTPQDQKPNVACTLPVLEVLAREVGGDDFTYFSLCKADQDPHYVRATPLLQRKLREADLFVEIGLQLEPWADLVANDSGRPRLQAGGAGRVVASAGIPREQVPVVIDRALGHIHPDGNPHVWLDPVRGKRVARNIARALEAAAPARKDAVGRRLKDFERRLDAAYFGTQLVDLVGAAELERRALDGTLLAWLDREELDGKKLLARAGGWLRKSEPLRGKKALEYHQDWVYAAKAFGFEIVGTVEEKPGIPPGPRHQLELTKKLREGGIALILVDNFYDAALPRRLSDDTGVPMVVLPNQPGGEPGTDTYFAFFDHLLDKVVGALRK
jgi:ABC-type Zn uptake system ZnuABC Zn-binding protein ZnuA